MSEKNSYRHIGERLPSAREILRLSHRNLQCNAMLKAHAQFPNIIWHIFISKLYIYTHTHKHQQSQKAWPFPQAHHRLLVRSVCILERKSWEVINNLLNRVAWSKCRHNQNFVLQLWDITQETQQIKGMHHNGKTRRWRWRRSGSDNEEAQSPCRIVI